MKDNIWAEMSNKTGESSKYLYFLLCALLLKNYRLDREDIFNY